MAVSTNRISTLGGSKLEGEGGSVYTEGVDLSEGEGGSVYMEGQGCGQVKLAFEGATRLLAKMRIRFSEDRVGSWRGVQCFFLVVTFSFRGNVVSGVLRIMTVQTYEKF